MNIHPKFPYLLIDLGKMGYRILSQQR